MFERGVAIWDENPDEKESSDEKCFKGVMGKLKAEITNETRLGVCVLVTQGDMVLIQKRAEDKNPNPGKLSLITGHVDIDDFSGEDPSSDPFAVAAMRELSEELGKIPINEDYLKQVNPIGNRVNLPVNFIEGSAVDPSQSDVRGNVALVMFRIEVDGALDLESGYQTSRSG